MSKPTGKPLISMRQALDDPRRVIEGSTWDAWRAVLIAARGEKLNKAERKIIEKLSGRTSSPGKPPTRMAFRVGRRGGKDRSASTLAAYLAALVDWRDVIVRGEIGLVLVAATNVQQARIAYNYISSLFDDVPAFRGMVSWRTADSIELGKMRTAIRVLPANAVSSRGHSYIAVILDEFAFFECRQDLQNTDAELVRALTLAHDTWTADHDLEPKVRRRRVL